MKNFSNHIKGIAYLLSMLTLFQSCVVYNKTPSTLEEATSNEEMPIKIITKDGQEYKFRLIEEKNGSIIGIKKTEKEYLLKKDIFQFAILSPAPHTVSLDTALNHDGKIRVLTNNNSEGTKSYEFIKIKEYGDKIIGFKRQGKDALPIIIPIEQIDKIILLDKEKSSSKTSRAIIASTLGIGLIVLFIIFANEIGGYSWD